MKQQLILWIFLLGISFSCQKDALSPGNDLEVVVTNADEQVTAQTQVKLYLSKSYFQEGVAFDSAITDAQGTVTFYALDPAINELYVEATKGQATNWGYRNYIALIPGPNKMVTKVEVSQADLLAGKLGKSWRQTGFVVDGISNETCEYRRIFRFERDGNLQIYTADDCKWAENFSAKETWELEFQNITIGSPTNPQAQKKGFIQILDEKNLQFFYQKSGANETSSTYVESFVAIDD